MSNVIAAILLVVLIAALILLGGLIFWAAWNLAVVPLAAAVGASVGKLGFWTAVGVNLGLGLILGMFRRPTP